MGHPTMTGQFADPQHELNETVSKDIFSSLAAINRIAESNAIVCSPEDATPFHSSVVPPMNLEQYAHRIAKYSGCGEIGLALGFVLMLRYWKATGTQPEGLTIHRLLLASVVVAMKTHSDFFYQNKYMAIVGGVSNSEINNLEIALLTGVQFSVTVSASDFHEAALFEITATLSTNADSVQLHLQRFLQKRALVACFESLSESNNIKVGQATVSRTR